MFWSGNTSNGGGPAKITERRNLGLDSIVLFIFSGMSI